jgi:hypothetical protein
MLYKVFHSIEFNYKIKPMYSGQFPASHFGYTFMDQGPTWIFFGSPPEK